jgi:methyl-accepting chemotaxis protein
MSIEKEPLTTRIGYAARQPERRGNGMTIGAKLLAVILALAAAGIIILVAVTISLSKREIEDLSYTNIRNLAVEHGRGIQNWIELYLDASRTVAQIMENFEDLEPSTRRSAFDAMLRGVVAANPEILGIWTIWEPNVLDGMDAVYAGTEGTDETGRYIPWWVKSNGAIIVQACVEYEEADYYQYPLLTGNEMVTDPTYWDIEGSPTLMTDLVVPIKRRGQVIGTVGIDIAVSVVQTKILEINPYEGCTAAVFSGQGTVVAHFDADRIAKPMRETEQGEAGPHLSAYERAVLNGEPYFFRNPAASLNRDLFFTAMPVQLGRTLNPWTISIGVPMSVVSAPIRRIFTASLIIAAGILLAVGLAAGIISRSISVPIKRLVSMLKDIAQGEGDLTKTISEAASGEIGELARCFNLSISGIRNMIVVIKQETLSLSKTGTDLAAAMNETASSINEIAAAIESVSGQTVKQSASVKGANAVMGELIDRIRTINIQVEKQSGVLVQSSKAVEQMLACLQSAARTLIGNKGNIEALALAATVGRRDLREVSADIQKIARQSEDLMQINTVMETVASQTKLLSMNAAIEAAHAGGAGRGFAVVAGEIRKLASSSEEQSKSIALVLGKIKESIDAIIRSSDAMLLNFERISEGVERVTDQELSARRALEEQEDGSRTILETAGSLNEIAGEVKQSAALMMNGSRQVILENKTLERLSVEIGNAMQEIAAGTALMDGAVNRVNDISALNKRQIETLTREVSRFKADSDPSSGAEPGRV